MSFKAPTATAAIILDTRYERTEGTYTVKLRVTYKRKQKYYALYDNKELAYTKEQFSHVFLGAPRSHDLKKQKGTMDDSASRARTIIEELNAFTWTRFETLYFDKRTSGVGVYAAFDIYVNQLKKEDRISTASSYSSAKISIQKFNKSKPLAFDDVDSAFLKSYQQWMKSQGASITTVGIYLRSLRTIMNIALRDGIIKSDQYPFGKAYTIPSGRNIKKALTKAQLSAIFQYQPEEGSAEHKSRDLWLFSYLANGINTKDIARLKYSNLTSTHIIFIRSKTENSKKAQKPIVVPRIYDLNRILERWARKDAISTDYVFDILEPGLPAEQEYKRIKQAVKTINKYMDRIRINLKIEDKVTTYFARHSFATTMMRSKAPTKFIADSLGHSLESTTNAYLSSFTNEDALEFYKSLTDF